MRRRRVLAVIGSAIPIAGCVSGESGPSNSTPRGGTRTATETSTEACSEVATEFERPSLAKPESLSAESAKRSGFEIERAYQETLDVSPDDFSEVPDRTDNFGYRLLDAEAVERRSGYRVEVRGLVSWRGVEGLGTETVVKTPADRPLRVATYEVTERRIHRRSGIGDLEGTILCW